MSLSIALKAATTGLNAAQTSLRVVSDNIANVNTPGYVRKAVTQQPLVVDGMSQGVKIEGIHRVTDQYLHTASLTAASEASRWNSVSQYLDNAQSLFGDPAGAGFFFNRLDKVFAAFATAADDPSSTLLRSQALANVEDFLHHFIARWLLVDAGRLGGSLRRAGGDVRAEKSWRSDYRRELDHALGPQGLAGSASVARCRVYGVHRLPEGRPIYP